MSCRPALAHPRGVARRCCSITDELETVCGLLSPSRTADQLSLADAAHLSHRTRHASEMSNPEMAMFLEKETLRDAEENDYHLMSDLIQHRYGSKLTCATGG